MVTFFSATMRLPGSQLEHAVDQQERVAVRQVLQDLLDVHRVHRSRSSSASRRSSARIRSAMRVEAAQLGGGAAPLACRRSAGITPM